MASGFPYAVAASFAHPGRPSIAIVGDGAFSMLMAELSTAVLYKWATNFFYGCELVRIDFAKFAEACGAKGFSVSNLSGLKPKIRAWLDAPGVAVIDGQVIQVDPDEAAVGPNDLRA